MDHHRPVYWFKGPSGEAFKVACASDGIDIPGISERLDLKPRTIQLNGVMIMYDSNNGFIPLTHVKSFISGLGDTEEHAIPVDGKPAGAATEAGAGRNNLLETFRRIEDKLETLMRSRAGLHVNHDSSKAQANNLSGVRRRNVRVLQEDAAQQEDVILTKTAVRDEMEKLQTVADVVSVALVLQFIVGILQLVLCLAMPPTKVQQIVFGVLTMVVTGMPLSIIFTDRELLEVVFAP